MTDLSTSVLTTWEGVLRHAEQLQNDHPDSSILATVKNATGDIIVNSAIVTAFYSDGFGCFQDMETFVAFAPGMQIELRDWEKK